MIKRNNGIEEKKMLGEALCEFGGRDFLFRWFLGFEISGGIGGL